ncbi:lysylphosphatidylglycerol synthase transmembrane domain-containing protein [Parafrankia discariae]|uniref:lysylphosphatidylglycerol synthase transmembrane domain-containing protein n=1 Tax=Parafrankia discariae TaxID=365528 RepID=UPI0003666D9D|nr:lysylphosphatidylglycerol synthase transmembrane domain-containing protein [Parafrankia discariae]
MVVEAPAEAVGPEPASGRRPAAGTASHRWRTALACVVPLLAVLWLLHGWSTVTASVDHLANARPGWLAVAVLAALPTWIAGAASLQGAVARRLPVGPMLAVQVAGSVANHVLPAGFGVGAVKLRFLNRHGVPLREAVAAVGLDATAGVITHVAVLVVLLSGGFAHLGGPPGGLLATVAAALVGLLAVGWALPPVRRAARRGRAHVTAQARMLAEILREPSRAMLLWGGSAAIPLLHAATLLFVVRALHLPLGAGAVFAIYYLASSASALIPSPGGFGSLDAALTAAIVAAGQSPTSALAAVLGYRLITVWIPLAPSACVMAALVRRGHL